MSRELVYIYDKDWRIIFGLSFITSLGMANLYNSNFEFRLINFWRRHIFACGINVEYDTHT